MKIYHYKVKVYRNPGNSEWNSNKFTIEEHEIAVQNEIYIILNDWYFTKLKKEKSNYDTVLNESSLRIRTNDNILENGIFYDLYSDKIVKPSKIKTEISNKIKKDYQWLFVGVDLSLIK